MLSCTRFRLAKDFSAKSLPKKCSKKLCLVMRCLTPIWMYDTGKLTASGKRLLTAKPSARLPFEAVALPVPCGKCEACLARRRSEWVARLRFEAFSSDSSSFVTLTYRDNPFELNKRDIQLFLKKLRNLPRDCSLPVGKLRYFVVGEYGKRFHRPHWHGVLFGVDFLSPPFSPELVSYKEGHPIYTSCVLERVWSHGFVTCDKVTPDSIKYVAKYVTKDECVSLKSQGIGRSLFVDVKRSGRKCSYRLRGLYLDHIEDGFLHLPDRSCGLSPVGIPKGFDRYLERCDASLFEAVKASRADFVRNLPFDDRRVDECLRCLDSKETNKERLLDYAT